MMSPPLQQSIQLIITLLQEGQTLLQHTAYIVHLHSQNLIHVLLFYTLLTEQVHSMVTLLQSNNVHQ